MTDNEFTDDLFTWRADGSFVTTDSLRKPAPLVCACNPDAGTQCQFHARQPRPCPACAAAGRDGLLQRYAGKGGHTFVPYAVLERHANPNVRWERSSRPIWTCNVCEHCEVA